MNEEIKLSKSEIIGICEFLKIHHFENSYLLLDYITNLQEEKEDYKSRCEKEIEYIHNHQLVFELSSKKQIQDWFDIFYKDSLNILNGGDE